MFSPQSVALRVHVSLNSIKIKNPYIAWSDELWIFYSLPVHMPTYLTHIHSYSNSPYSIAFCQSFHFHSLKMLIPLKAPFSINHSFQIPHLLISSLQSQIPHLLISSLHHFHNSPFTSLKTHFNCLHLYLLMVTRIL